MEANQTVDKNLVAKAIKLQKWDRSSYEYALNYMLPYRYFSDSQMYKKSDLIELFYKSIQDEDKWNKIKNFTTFRNL